MLPPEEVHQVRQLWEDWVRLHQCNRVRVVKWQLVWQSRKKRHEGEQQSWRTGIGRRVCLQHFLLHHPGRRDGVPEEDWESVFTLR